MSLKAASKTKTLDKTMTKEMYLTSMVDRQLNGPDIITHLKKKLFFDPIAKKTTLKLINKTGNFNIMKQTPPIYIILPNSRTKKMWDLLIFCFIIYSVFIVPLDIGWNLECFSPNEGNAFKLMYLFSTILFFIDIFLNFFTAVLDDKNNYIYEIDKILQAYMKEWFLIDVITSIPFDRIRSFNMSDCFQPYISPSKQFMFLYFLRFFKMSKFLGTIERDFSRYSMQIRFIKLFFFILYFAHIVGNLFSGNSPTIGNVIFYNCSSAFPSNSPEYLACAQKLMRNKFINVYFYSVYLGIVMSFGNDVQLQQNWEMVIFMIVTVVSTVINASIYGNVAVMLSKLSFGVSPLLREKLDVMKEYMSFMNFDERFINQIEEYHVNIWLKQRNMMYEDNFLNDMSLALQRILLLEQWKDTFFMDSSFLPIISDDFTLDMVPLFKPKIFMNNDVIITEGDSASDVFFIPKTGLCQVRIGGEYVKTMSSGDYFGEVSIFLRSKRRTATVTCLKDSDFLFLSGHDFEKLLKDFPDDHNVIKKLAINRLLENMKLYPAWLFAKLVPNNNLRDYLFRKCIYLENEEEDALFSAKKAGQLMDLSMFNHKIDQLVACMSGVKTQINGISDTL